ncbi:hypothetical protein G6F40_014268 [Rhizopus arrhizus]|nr:hypothetical protein G6F40_014268 [Rhizopus arrhizus]
MRGGRRRLRPQQRQRRHQATAGHVFAGDQRERRVRAGAGAEHHAGTGIQRAEEPRRAHREVVCGRQRDQVHAVAVDAADRVAGTERIDVVVVRTRNQLGQAGAATGDLQESHRLRVRVGRQLGAVALQPVQRDEFLRIAVDHHRAYRRHVGLQCPRQPAMIEAVVQIGGDVGTGFGLVGERGTGHRPW